MLSRLMNTAIGSLIAQFLQEKVRQGSLKAVKTYIEAVKIARLGLLGLFGLGMLSALLMSGIVLTIVGIVGLLPIEASTMAITTLVLGVVFLLVSGIIVAIMFNQKLWLEYSQSYRLMAIAMEPWDGVLPPNPLTAFASSAADKSQQKSNSDKEDRPIDPLFVPPPPQAERSHSGGMTPQGAH